MKFFPHFEQARNDNKLSRIIYKYGSAGYGLYFMILEKMLETEDYELEQDYDFLSHQFHEEADFIKSIVEDYGLFEFTDDGKFFSSRFKEHMEYKDDIKKKRSEAGKKGGQKKAENTNNDKGKEEESEAEKSGSVILLENCSSKTLANGEDFASDFATETKTKTKTKTYNKNKKEKQEKENGSSKSTRGELENYISDLDVGEELKTALNDFVEMRKKNKKPLTLKALELTVKDLNKLSSDEREQVLIVQKSIKRSWQGVFALKDQDKRELGVPAEKKTKEKYVFMEELTPEEKYPELFGGGEN